MNNIIHLNLYFSFLDLKEQLYCSLEKLSEEEKKKYQVSFNKASTTPFKPIKIGKSSETSFQQFSMSTIHGMLKRLMGDQLTKQKSEELNLKFYDDFLNNFKIDYDLSVENLDLNLIRLHKKELSSNPSVLGGLMKNCWYSDKQNEVLRLTIHSFLKFLEKEIEEWDFEKIDFGHKFNLVSSFDLFDILNAKENKTSNKNLNIDLLNKLIERHNFITNELNVKFNKNYEFVEEIKYFKGVLYSYILKKYILDFNLNPKDFLKENGSFSTGLAPSSGYLTRRTFYPILNQYTDSKTSGVGWLKQFSGNLKIKLEGNIEDILFFKELLEFYNIKYLNIGHGMAKLVKIEG